MTPEVTLWRSVLLQAALDASGNINDGLKHDAKWHYEWAKGEFCKRVCLYAQIDHDCVIAGFKRIYENSKKGSKNFHKKRKR